MESKEHEKHLIMKGIYEEILNDNKWKLAIVPSYEDFKESDDYKNITDYEMQDEDDLKDIIKLYLQDFTEMEIKKKMLAEAKSRNSCTQKEVRIFEEQGRKIILGMTAEEYMNSFDKDSFEDEDEKKAYREEFVIEVKYGIVDYVYC